MGLSSRGLSFAFLAGSALAQDIATNTEALSYGWLAEERLAFCRYVSRAPPQLDEEMTYPAVAHESQANYDYRMMVEQWRGRSELKGLMQSCSLVGGHTSVSDKGKCEEEAVTYGLGLVPLIAPMILSIICMVIWKICCWMAICRCCRRCCLCFERKAPRGAGLVQRVIMLFAAFVGIIVVVVTAVVAYSQSDEISAGINDSLCHLLTMADEAMNGSPATPVFLGVDVGIQRMNILRSLLDVDGRAMTDIRGILDDTAPFASAMDDLMAKIHHMQRMLTLVGQHKIKEHSCWFCERAIGNNVTGDLGLLPELLRELSRSSADAMRQIQLATASTLMGDELIQVSRALQQGSDGLEIFKRGFGVVFVESILSHRNLIQGLEDGRHTAFQFMCGFCIIHAAVASTAILCHSRRSKRRFPSPAPACIGWFCGFCGLVGALLFSGLLLFTAVPISEACGFGRYELMTNIGVTEYYRQLGLYPPWDAYRRMDVGAVEVFKACLTPDGSGEVLRALGLEGWLGFQEVLDRRFIELEDKMAGRVVDTAKFELLVSQAQAFGGLFQLAPDEPLPLAPSAVAKMMGSSVEPDDREGPDGETVIAGLNTYASLIAGPGKYSFQHGTAGGGTLITATKPTPADVSNAPLTMQNALTYGRLKEQLLTEEHVLRCDIMDARHHVVERPCSYEEFVVSVQMWAEQVKEAGYHLGTEAQRARPIIANDLRDSLQGVLMEVRRLRTTFRCRFLWKRWEDLDMMICNYALPGMLQGFAAWMALACGGFILVILHYKIWRHMLDNRIVGEELERFSEKYKYLQVVKAG